MASVLVGISGGIDSAMTALLLKDKGYKVTGVHFNFTGENSPDQNEKLTELKHKLGIEIIEFEAQKLFTKEVIGYYTRNHLMGKTPSPCSHCNPAVKWKLLSDLADARNIEYIATGHYVRIVIEKNRKRILKGTDEKKDQSYYLWRLNKDILNRALTPLGNMYKSELRKQAFEKGFGFLARERESTGLCFSRGRDCEKMLNDYIPDLTARIKPGNVLNREGIKIGKHKGYIYYTIGQKQGLTIFTGEKLCVASIDAINNIIVADNWQSLYKDQFLIEDFVFPDMDELESSQNIKTIVRGFGLNPDCNTRLIPLDNNLIKVKLETPAWAPAPGQPAVFYSDNKLLGGGIIC